MSKTAYKQALPPGHRVDDYKLLKVLGVGGFGVTYLAEDVKLGSRVAIKEYLPNEFAVRDGTTVHPKSGADQQDFEWGLKRFLDEARTLAQFHHRNLVRVLRYFEANSTAYFVMEYEEGESLEDLLSRRRTLTERQLKGLLLPLLDGLKSVHAEGFLHRDIKPSNVFVRRDDESPVLLDFGAARNALGRKSRSMTAVVTPGYSPPEQYESDGEQGPWTDIYALSALCFRVVTGNRPEEAPRRQRLLFQEHPDPLLSLEKMDVSDYSTQLLAAVDWGLRIDDRERPRNVDEWLAAMNGLRSEEGATDDVVEPSLPSKHDKSVAEAQGKKYPKTDKRLMLARRPIMFGLAALAMLGAAVSAALLVFQKPAQPIPFTAGEESDEANRVTFNGIPPEPTPSFSFTVINESSQAISGIFANPDHLRGWGANRLEGGLVQAGRELVVNIYDDSGSCQYDVLITSEAGLERQFDDQNLCDLGALTFGGGQVLTVVNESGNSIEAVYASPDNTDGHGENRLASGLTIPGDEQFRVQIYGHGNHCLFDVSIVSDESMQKTYDGLNLCEVERVVFQAEVSSPPLAPFTVETHPPDARVRILNIGPAYQAQMPLVPGEYSVEVSAPGYETSNQTVSHGLDATVHRIELRTASPQVGDRFRDCPQCPEMVVVPAGRFTMGSRREAGRHRDEGPVHLVTIGASFGIGVAEVTFAEWDACVADGGCAGYRPSDEGWGRGTRPVINVSWEDADQYVGWLSGKTGQVYRLPSEAEWEYAARAETTTARYWGEDAANQCRHANGADKSAGEEYPDLVAAPCHDEHVHTALIDGIFTPNGWGLRHTLGNVWEWTADCRHDNYVGAPVNGSAWTKNCSGELVLRGGSWASQPRFLRSAARSYRSLSYRDKDAGFRVARSMGE